MDPGSVVLALDETGVNPLATFRRRSEIPPPSPLSIGQIRLRLLSGQVFHYAPRRESTDRGGCYVSSIDRRPVQIRLP